MHPFVANDHLTTSWLLKALTTHTPGKTPVQSSTLNLWHERGLFSYTERGYPEPDSAAAMLIARMVDRRERNWLPTIMTQREPRWWCWRQDRPDAPVVACPIPLPDDLPPSALLWTPWLGACWHIPWLQIGLLGAARFAGTQGPMSGEEWRWNLSLEDFHRWDPEMAAFALPPDASIAQPKEAFFTRDISRDVFQLLVHVSLFRLMLAPVRLGMFRQSSSLDLTALGIE